MNAKQVEMNEAIAELKKIVKAGDTVYTILRHVSSSGMSRSISLLIHTPEGPREITHLVRRADNLRFDEKHGGVKVGGCGMDMGFHLVYNLASMLFREGFACTGKDCPSNAHTNGDRDYTPHEHKSGGYALRHRWL